MIRATAPGKLMLAGEYVVLERGLPALAVAIDRRLEVEITADSMRRSWCVTSEAIGLKDAPLKQVPVLAEVLARVPGVPQGGRIVVRSELGAGPGKPGLGGSAALCAAAFAGLWKLVGAQGSPDLDLAIAAHRAAQGGVGSGYDVATSLSGGVALVYTSNRPTALVEQLSWPEGLHAAIFKAHRGSATAELIQKLAAWRDEDLESFEACIDPLAAETEAFIAAFRAGDVVEILDAAAQVQEELMTLDRIGELGILGGGQLQLLGVIEDHGAIGRTSGAGGGDCAWALTDEPEIFEGLTRELAKMGFERVDVGLGASGVSVGETT